MSKYFRNVNLLHRCIWMVRTQTPRNVLVHNYGLRIPIEVIISVPNTARYFSVKVPTAFHKDQEKFSDSDSDDDVSNKEDVLDVVTKSGRPLSSVEWETVKAEILSPTSRMKRVNSYNLDALVIFYCIKYRQLDVALSYMKHLTQINKKPNVATVLNFLRLCYFCQEKTISEQLILSMYDELRDKYPVLDATTCEGLILGLCLTTRWKEGLELLDMAKLTCLPGSLEYVALAKAAFDNEEPAIGMKLTEEIIMIGRQLRPELFHAWLDYLDRLSGGDRCYRWRLIEEVLQMVGENNVKLAVDVAEKLKLWYEEVRPEHQASLTMLTERGICKSCQRQLNPIRISKMEFESLRSGFMDRVVVGRDIFTKTTPTELKEFKDFVENTAPYDIVIDGLNIAYAGGHKKHLPKNGALSLEHVVRHFVTKSKKVLVLGRNHMKSWNHKSMNYVFKNAHVFLAQDLSQDDPFLLYATLYSGLGTCFLSKDLMRSHVFLLKNKALRSIFRSWQLQHQYQLKYITQSGQVYLKFPLPYNPVAQKSKDGCWHIPYETEYSPNPAQMMDGPTSWLCLSPQNVERTTKRWPVR